MTEQVSLKIIKKCPPLPPLCQGRNQTLERPANRRSSTEGTTLEVIPHCPHQRKSQIYLYYFYDHSLFFIVVVDVVVVFLLLLTLKNF